MTAIHRLNVYLMNPLSHKYNHLSEMETLQGLTEVHPRVGNHEAEEFCGGKNLKIVNAVLDSTMFRRGTIKPFRFLNLMLRFLLFNQARVDM